VTCPHCEAYERNRLYGGYHPECEGCNIRSIAGSPAYSYSLLAGTILSPYKARLVSVFGDDWRAGHDKVKAFFKGAT
jgi:hypothetical protein